MLRFLILTLALLMLASAWQEPRAKAEWSDVEMGRVFIEGEFLNGNILKVSVMTEDIETPVLGASFDLQYGDDLHFLRYEPGDFLERGGDPFYLVKPLDKRLVFGATLRRDDEYPVGFGKISDFYFQIIEGQEFALNFENGVLSTVDTVRQDINNVSFEDGYIERVSEGGQMLDSVDSGGQVPVFWDEWWEVLAILPFVGLGSFFVFRTLKKRLNAL